MKKEKFSKRLKNFMESSKLKQIDIINKCKPLTEKYYIEENIKIQITKSDLSQWLSGKYEPGQWKLMILSEALNVSPVWLMGYDVSQKINNTNQNLKLLINFKNQNRLVSKISEEMYKKLLIDDCLNNLSIAFVGKEPINNLMNILENKNLLSSEKIISDEEIENIISYLLNNSDIINQSVKEYIKLKK